MAGPWKVRKEKEKAEKVLKEGIKRRGKSDRDHGGRKRAGVLLRKGGLLGEKKNEKDHTLSPGKRRLLLHKEFSHKGPRSPEKEGKQ